MRGEPADVYGDMDFATRDRYRHVVETLARYSALSEIEVARKAVELAQESARQKGREDRTAHVGFYLIDKGLPRLERAAARDGRGKGFVERSIRKFPFTFYVGGIFLFTLLATLEFVHAAEARGVAGWQLIFLRGHIFARSQSAGGGLMELARHCAAQAATFAPSRTIHRAGSRRTAAAWSSFPPS